MKDNEPLEGSAAGGVFLFVFLPLSMIIDNLHAIGVSVPPLETDAPLVLDADAPLSFPVAGGISGQADKKRERKSVGAFPPWWL